MSALRQLVYNLVKYNRIQSSIWTTKRPQISKQLLTSCGSALKMSSFQFSSVEELKVKHNSKGHKFYIKLGEDEALLIYRDVSPGVIDLYHTEVPQSLQGKGIAKKLAQEAFEYVVNQNLKMRVTCTYLQKYLSDNPKPEYVKQVVK